MHTLWITWHYGYTTPVLAPQIALPPLPLFGKHPFPIHEYLLQIQTKQSRVHTSLILLVPSRCPGFHKARHQTMRAEPWMWIPKRFLKLASPNHHGLSSPAPLEELE